MTNDQGGSGSRTHAGVTSPGNSVWSDCDPAWQEHSKRGTTIEQPNGDRFWYGPLYVPYNDKRLVVAFAPKGFVARNEHWPVRYLVVRDNLTNELCVRYWGSAGWEDTAERPPEVEQIIALFLLLEQAQ